MAIFNEDMAARVKAFQQANGLAMTGVVSKETWETLLPQKSQAPQAVQELQAPEAPGAPEEQVSGKAAGEVLLAREDFPLTYEIATLTTEAAVIAFLKGRGIDLDAIVAYGEAVSRGSKPSDIS